MAASWDATRAKAQFRLTAQRLGQLRDRKDAQGQVTGRDISILLQQGNVMLARAKAQKLIQDEIMGNVLENLEMQIGVLLERFSDLESRGPSPAAVESASTIIYAAPSIDSRDLHATRDLLGFRLGPDFLRSASTNQDRHVSPQILRALSAPPASAAQLDDYLVGLAHSYGVQWAPDLRPDEVLASLSEILDTSNDAPIVDIPRLATLCGRGIPSSPAWLRPRIWKLLLGTLPVLKASWEGESRKHRDSYYDLVRRLLEPFGNLPPPTDSLVPLDASLMNSIKDLFRVPVNLFSGLEEAPESSDGPLDEAAADGIRIACALNLDIRLEAIHSRDATDSDAPAIPEIRLEPDSPVAPDISVTAPDSDSGHATKTLYSSQAFSSGGAHHKHASALIRLLYIHSCLNPANKSPHMASLLIPLYSVLNQEVEPQDLAHVEADTFWLFEAMVGEFTELEDEEGGNRWMQHFGDRLHWADPELSVDLHAKGLDPSLPHYSYRWMAPILTHTLPLPSVLSVWDALFARPMTTRDSSPKLEYLLDICTSMLLRARGPLFRLGKSGRRSPGLWGEGGSSMGPPSPVRAWELNDAFIEGMALLQMYPVESAGGIDSILQTAAELARRREEESKVLKNANATLGTRLRETVWRGFTNRVSSPLSSPDTSGTDDESSSSGSGGDETETQIISSDPKSPGLTSRLANVVWKGITNQSAMEPPPSPLSPMTPPMSPLSPLPPPDHLSPLLSPARLSPSPSPTKTSPLPPTPSSPTPSSPSSPAPGQSIWSYAEKLKDSDAAATLAKVSTNWRVKAMQAWSTRGASGPSPAEPAASSSSAPKHRSESLSSTQLPAGNVDGNRRGSLPNLDRDDGYTPPPRPAHFRNPRDSMIPHPKSPLSSPTSPDSAAHSGPTKTLKDSIASFAGLHVQETPKTTPKAGPRPLLLSTSSLMTGAPAGPLRSPDPRRDSTDVLRSRQYSRQDSVSSLASISGAHHSRRTDTRSDWESDATESRVIPLHRKSVSPMALASRAGHGRLASQSSSSDKGAPSPRFNNQALPSSPAESNTSSARRGWGRVDGPESPTTTLPSSPPPHTPPPPLLGNYDVAVSGAESQRGSMVISTPTLRDLEPPSVTRKLVRKKTPPPKVRTEYASDSSAPPEMPLQRNPRLRSKRSTHHLTNLHIQSSGSTSPADSRAASPNSLALPEFDDHDNATTPRATNFQSPFIDGPLSSASPVSPASPRRTRKLSTEARTDGAEPRVRKLSSERRADARVRKTSTDGQEVRPRKISTGGQSDRVRRKISDARRDSAAEEGDDEGYDDLLSAYESEDSSTQQVLP
ncbi:hypothetical protein FA95DRAFT_1600501 [Auriscalpium vulgare]|uniref:Uncharacterized protein n=1 Tax=Auriscalpium vulgare TaxID=40419 RepID=A0ACB8SDI7_9AGAM|nr:hypothetical protein FA95DRAFT_1600501 [Auriscalpium vulgare]